MNNNKPLLILQPTPKWFIANCIHALLIFIITVPLSYLFLLLLSLTVFKIDWLNIFNYLIAVSPPSLSELAYFIAVFIFISITFLIIFSWVVFVILAVIISFLYSIYTYFARKYIRYEFHSKFLVIQQGIFVKTQKVYPFRSITSIKRVQSYAERLLGIGTLVVTEPQLLPALIHGINNDYQKTIFSEFTRMLSKAKNRLITKSDENIAKFKTQINGEEFSSLEEPYSPIMKDKLAEGLKELKITIKDLDSIFQKKKKRISPNI